MNFASQKYLKLDPKLFKAFMAVAEYGSYATAAKKSAQSPSVVSDHMIKIRETLGHDVVIKVSDTYKLTSAGKMLQQYIRRIMDVTAEFHDGLDQGQESMEGMVVQEVQGDIIIENNEQLKTIDGFKQLRYTKYIGVVENINLKSIDAFKNWKYADASETNQVLRKLLIKDCPVIEDLTINSTESQFTLELVNSPLTNWRLLLF